MSVSTKILQSNKVPIELQIETGAIDRFPQAVVRDDANTILNTIDLNHLSNGLYKAAADFLMPGNQFVTVQYLVYDDASHTIISSDLGRDSDVFVRDTVVVDQSILIGDFVAQLKDNDSLFAEVFDDDLITAIIPDDDLTGSIEENDDLQAGLEDDTLKGDIEC